ncbi:MAG: DNA repair protein RecO, partial [Chloroflexi bacterium]|nr:DNA repair protein RecO [Chloroflexota bacterium]
MAQPRVYRTEAIVLRQRPLAEADKVCVLFTPLHGRIEAVAKGVRRSRSRLAGHVEPLTRSRFLIARTRSLDIITQAETVDAFPVLHAELDRLGLALCAAELVDRFTDTAADVGALYRLLLDTLGRLESGPAPALALRWFELRLLDDQGYRPQLGRCVRCDAAPPAEGAAFAVGAGGVVCPDCR